MSSAVKPIPDGYHTVTPYLIVDDAAGAIAFYQRAFGTVERFRMDGAGGKIMHAELQLGDSRIMLADANPDWKAASPKTLGGSPITLMVYVEDVDAVFAQALAAGATEIQPLADQFYGDRSGTVADPFGHKWHLSTHKEDLSPEELRQRAMTAC